MNCSKCGSTNIDIQVFQENQGSVTTSKTTSKYKEKGHGCLWWICIGWWWWIVDLCMWFCFFIPRLVLQLFKKKKYKGSASTVSTSQNIIVYRRICTCKDCGHTWSQQG